MNFGRHWSTCYRQCGLKRRSCPSLLPLTPNRVCLSRVPYSSGPLFPISSKRERNEGKNVDGELSVGYVCDLRTWEAEAEQDGV